MNENTPSRRSEERTLTDADVDAIAEKLLQAGAKRFYLEAGRGLWGLVWKVIVVALVALAAYGAGVGKH